MLENHPSKSPVTPLKLRNPFNECATIDPILNKRPSVPDFSSYMLYRQTCIIVKGQRLLAAHAMHSPLLCELFVASHALSPYQIEPPDSFWDNLELRL